MAFVTSLRRFGLAALWAVTVAFMVRDWRHDPFDPAREGTQAYGHNAAGALLDGIVVTAIELGVLYLILQPWKRDRSGLWIVLALVMLVPWTLFSGMLCMHAGGIFAIHFFWLSFVAVALVGALLASGVNALSGRGR
jgi:hypothetical protein